MTLPLVQAVALAAIVLVGAVGLYLSRGWPGRGGAPRLWDLVICVGSLLWGTSWGTLLGLLALGVPWEGAGEVPMVAALVGSAAGGLCATAVALVRVGRRALGLGAPPLRWLGVALLCLPPFLLLSAAWTALLERFRGPVEDQLLVDLLRDLQGSISGQLIALFALLGAPLFEEVLFRGVALSALSRHLGPGGAVLATALAFGALHGADPDSVPPLCLLGLLLGWLRQRSGSLWPSIVLHVANNGLVLLSLALAPA